MKNIVLIGMPGCGKTTIGKLLSKKMNLKFIDIDEYIEKTENRTIKDIFSFGEEVFRRIEKEAVLKISKEQSTVISTGGGVIKDYYNIQALKKNGVIVFIDRPLEYIIKDMDVYNRPLLKDGLDRIYNLYDERYGLYKEFCDFYIINKATIEQIINEIMKVLEKNKFM